MKVLHALDIFYKGVQTPIQMGSILTTSEHQAQLECTECNHCVHLSILHIQMCAKSRSNHTHSWKCCIHSTYFTKVCKHQYKWAVFLTTSEHQAQLECTECNHCVHLRFCTFRCAPNPDLIILTHESAACTRHILQRCANTNRNGQYFDNVRAPSAARMYRM